MALGETLHRIVDPFRSQAQRGQGLENVDRTPAAVLDHSPSHGGVIEVSGAIDREVSVRQWSLELDIGFPHSEDTHYSWVDGWRR